MSVTAPARQHEIASLSDAYEVLVQRNPSAGRVVSYDDDSILYLTPQGKPRTAWLHRGHRDEIERIKIIVGFVAEPPPFGWWTT